MSGTATQKVSNPTKSHRQMKIGDLLIHEGLIDQEQLEKALVIQKARRKKLGEVLIDMGFVTDVQVAKALAGQTGYPLFNPHNIEFDKGLLAVMSQEDVEKYNIFPVRMDDNELTIAMSNPLDFNTIDEIRFKTGYKLSIMVATESDVKSSLEKHYKVEERVFDLMNTIRAYEDVRFLKEEEAKVNEKTLFRQSEAAPIIKIVTMIIVDAIKMRASDIHIEPKDGNVKVRYRVDGDLRDVFKIPKRVQEAVISRIKIISDLDITNRRHPQDGACKLTLEDREVNLRISTMPTLYGEKVVIRLLDKSKDVISLAKIGFPDEVEKNIVKNMAKRQGFMLVTGPTGSGKTTTLYALLQQLRSDKENVISVEDPVEYRLKGVTQTAVNDEIGLTFSKILRSVLRQDPDIIMVGEIRDHETADIAIKASLTGHMVLSTLHTNDTVSSITRLIDLGIPRYLVCSSLTCILAQRLVKRVCPDCKVEDWELSRSMLSEFGDIKQAYRGIGCDNCYNTGYSGQVGVFELLTINNTIRQLIADGASENQIWEAARQNGLVTLFEDATTKINSGLTSMDEVLTKVPQTSRHQGA